MLKNFLCCTISFALLCCSEETDINTANELDDITIGSALTYSNNVTDNLCNTTNTTLNEDTGETVLSFYYECTHNKQGLLTQYKIHSPSICQSYPDSYNDECITAIVSLQWFNSFYESCYQHWNNSEKDFSEMSCTITNYEDLEKINLASQTREYSNH